MSRSEPLLTPAEEQRLFREFNHWRSEVARCERAADGRARRWAGHYRRKAQACRERIVRANFGLIFKMIERTWNFASEREELASQGQVALMKAVEKFDVERGVKFSTYACWAMLNDFSRLGQKQVRRNQHEEAGEIDVALAMEQGSTRQTEPNTWVMDVEQLLDGNPAQLSAEELEAVVRRFGLRGRYPETLAEIGEEWNYSRERVRQIQAAGVRKLREYLEKDSQEQ